MCFSAEASFGAAIVLGSIGVVSVRRAPSRAYVPFASVPLFFAMQQAIEGALWLVLAKSPYWRSSTSLGQMFLFFALLVWPSYLPFALSFVERDGTRRKMLVALTILGLAFGGYLMACATLRPSYACVAFHNIYYGVQVDVAIKRLVPFLYLVTIAAPLLVSSMRGTMLFGVASIASFLAAGVFYRVGFASVWCFFAAILSAMIVWMVHADHRHYRVADAPMPR